MTWGLALARRPVRVRTGFWTTLGSASHIAAAFAVAAAVTAALKDPEVARRIRPVGMEPTPTTPDGFTAYLAGDIAKAAKIAPVTDDKPN